MCLEKKVKLLDIMVKCNSRGKGLHYKDGRYTLGEGIGGLHNKISVFINKDCLSWDHCLV